MSGNTVTLLSLLALFRYVFCVYPSFNGPRYNEDWLEELSSNDNNYDRNIRPSDGEATIVYMSIMMQDLNTINERNSEFTMILIMVTQWTDDRLAFHNMEKNSSGIRLIRSMDCEKRIWTPALNIVNEKSSNPSSKLNGNENFCNVYENGTVQNFARMKLTLSCDMDLHNYPLDKQLCKMEVQSWLLTKDDLQLKFADQNSFLITDTFNLLEFRLVNHNLNSTVISYIELGEHSALIVSFLLKRELGHYLFNYYVPSTIFVIASWTSFWLHPEAAPPRVTLALTTMLTLVTSAKSSVSELPKIAYVKALDFWHVGCTGFILLSLFEFTIVNVLARRGRHLKKKQTNNDLEIESEPKRLVRSHSTRTICQEEITGIHRSVSTIDLDDDDSLDRERQGKMNEREAKKPSRYLAPPMMSSTNHDRSFEIPDDYIEVKIPIPDVNWAKKNEDNREYQKDGLEKNNDAQNPTGLYFRVTQRITQYFREISSMDHKQLATAVDRKSRIVFPLCFCLFNLIYWCSLL